MRVELLVLNGSGRCSHIRSEAMPSSQALRTLSPKEHGWRKRYCPSVISGKLRNPECYLRELWK